MDTTNMKGIPSELVENSRAGTSIFYGNRNKFDVAVEKKDAEISYIYDLEGRKANCTWLSLGTDRDNLLGERYKYTLREYVNREEFFKECWVQSHHRWRMAENFQELIKKLVIKINAMIELRIDFSLDADSIVLGTNLEPQFKKKHQDDAVVGVDNISNLWEMFHGILEEIINRIESEAGVKGNVHTEVHEFANKIERCTGSHCEIMASHPALRTEQDRLLFLLEIKNRFHRNRGYPFQDNLDYEEWRNELGAANNFGGLHEFLGTSHDPNQNCEFHVGYLYFINNCYEHMMQRTSTCPQYCMENFAKDIDNVHPEFASYVFNRYVDGFGLLKRDEPEMMDL